MLTFLFDLSRHLLLQLPPEIAHSLGKKSLQLWAQGQPWLPLPSLPAIDKPCEVMGLTFPNPVGMAAGWDTSGDYLAGFATLGFGFIELGSVTPRPQTGNPKARMFRFKQQRSLINRMGFPNKGAEYMAHTLATKKNYHGVLGISIAKCYDTPLEDAAKDYLFCMETLFEHADYFVVNASSPNTPGLRKLLGKNYLGALLAQLSQRCLELSDKYQKKTPLLLKLSPDMSEEELEHLAECVMEHGLEGVVATNTTLQRPSVMADLPSSTEGGGLSGGLLTKLAQEVTERLITLLKGQAVVIGSGGLVDIATIKERINAGVVLIELGSGLVFQGPGLIREACQQWPEALNERVTWLPCYGN